MLNLLNRHFCTFLVVGFINTVIGYSIIFVLLNIFNLGYFFSTLIGYIIGNISGYLLHKFFTFQNKGKFVITYFKFVMVFLVSYVVAILGGKIISDISSLYFGIFKTNTLLKENFAVVVVNYYGNRSFTFNNSENGLE